MITSLHLYLVLTFQPFYDIIRYYYAIKAVLNIPTNKEQSRKPLFSTKTIISTVLFLGLSYLSINPVFSSSSERVSPQATIPHGNRVDLAVVVSSTITDLTMVPANGAEVSHAIYFHNGTTDVNGNQVDLNQSVTGVITATVPNGTTVQNLNPSADCIDVQTDSGNLMQVVRTCSWGSLAAAVQNTQVMQFIIPANDSTANRAAINIEASISTQGESIDAMGNNLSFMNRLQEALESFYFYLPLITS